MKQRVDVEGEVVASPFSSAGSYKSQEIDDVSRPPSVRSFTSFTRKGASLSSTASSYNPLTSEEVRAAQNPLPYLLIEGSNPEVITKTFRGDGTDRVQEMESQVESREEERPIFEGFNINDDCSHNRIDGQEYIAPALSRVGCNCLWGNRRRKCNFFAPILALCLFIAMLIILFYVMRASTTMMRKKLIKLLDGANISVLTEGISLDTGDRCPLVYTLSEEFHKTERWEREGLDEDEIQLIGTIIARICSENVKDSMMWEVLRGAHIVVFGDGGWFHNWFSDMKGAKNRTSSHFSPVGTVGVPERRLLKTLLSGKDMFGNTWFQFEYANWNPEESIFDSTIHMVNYVQYKITGLQIGPLGVSKHTDQFPIMKKFDGCVASS